MFQFPLSLIWAQREILLSIPNLLIIVVLNAIFFIIWLIIHRKTSRIFVLLLSYFVRGFMLALMNIYLTESITLNWFSWFRDNFISVIAQVHLHSVQKSSYRLVIHGSELENVPNLQIVKRHLANDKYFSQEDKSTIHPLLNCPEMFTSASIKVDLFWLQLDSNPEPLAVTSPSDFAPASS